MFSRVLIANRGEIALRILRACQELGVETVCIYSEADRDAMYLRFADETICVGPSASAQSYLDVPRVISAAEIADVEAIHPGYGFLAENAHFAEVCRDCRIGWIGPDPEVIRSMGDKITAKEIARRAGVPLIPGSDGLVETEQEALAVAHEIGFPVIIKATAGGGGRGMRIAHNEISFLNAYAAARSEAEVAFKNPGVYIERYIESARHVEIQVLADAHGTVLHLGERDCSIQRRHQKLLEEAPSPALDEGLRERMGQAAVALAREAGYVNAGTVEFLLDDRGDFYFIEMNTRIQVEHPVTEEVTGIDLVAWQIRIAAGERLPFRQEDVRIRGHAIECRINAEDPDDGFKPRAGTIERLFVPGGRHVRWDSHIYAGYTVPPTYDSMVGKLIVWGEDREAAIERMKRALGELVVEGVPTSASLHRRIMNNTHFNRGRFDTGFIEDHF
ncbi:MAG: acetyl-CoA carboxylase biotin carboxylase subunit [Planctomycetota bacterium]|nr:MAG: acetyl-CoA carboxylase biotin carboxylase subunit [Planctomycetota bacterium]